MLYKISIKNFRLVYIFVIYLDFSEPVYLRRMAEQFFLRWNDFHSNLSTSFHALLEDEDLVDVTLAAEGRHLRAHKLILSVCSPYFKELFKGNPCSHPIVILKDVQHTVLRQILEFMYKGEVNVKQQDFTNFLHAAELLQVKGLTVGPERANSSPQPPSENEAVSPYVMLNEEANTFDWTSQDESEYTREEERKSPLKRLLTNSHNFQKKKKSLNERNHNYQMNDYSGYGSDTDMMSHNFDSDLAQSMLEVSEGKVNIKSEQNFNNWNAKVGGVKCPSCHRFFANRYNLKVHIRDKHDTMEGTIQCEVCNKRMRNPSCLRVHMYHHRKQAAILASQSSNDSTPIKEENSIPTITANNIEEQEKQDVQNVTVPNIKKEC